jgi:hypothetical protein
MEPDDLKSIAIRETFSTLPLEKRRRLITDLLKSAAIVHSVPLEPMMIKFEEWLLPGSKKFNSEEEANHAWGIWCYIKELTVRSECENERDDYGHHRIVYFLYNVNDDPDAKPFTIDVDEDVSDTESPPTDRSKEEFFDSMLRGRSDCISVCTREREIFRFNELDMGTTIETLIRDGWCRYKDAEK